MERRDALMREEHLHSRILLQVHDELVIEAPAEEVERTVQLVKEKMEGVAQLRVRSTGPCDR